MIFIYFYFCLLWLQMLCKKSWFRQDQQLVRHAGNRSVSHCEPQRLAQSDTSVQAFTGPGLQDDIIQWADMAQPAHTVRQSSKCCPPQPPPPPREAFLCFDGLFLFLEKCSSVTTTETAGLLLQDKWSEEWLREERDQTCGFKPFCKTMTGSRLC